MSISVSVDAFKLAQVFTISRGSRTQADVLTVCIERDGVKGYGECVPYARYGETLESVRKEIQGVNERVTRGGLQTLPAGAARNALDCALWDLEAKTQGKPVWELAGLPKPGPIETAYTLSLESPEQMQASAAKNAHRPLLKTKLGGGAEDVERIKAVRRGAPDAKIIVDANEGWTPELYQTLAPVLVDLGVAMVEQPFPADADSALLEINRVLPVCADESCHDRASLPALKGKYDMVNIKLDKTGGLSEAIALKEAAIAEGYEIMVGCMVGSSLAMAPAVLVAQGAAIVDLDGPLLLGEDRQNALHYDEAGVHPATAELWG